MALLTATRTSNYHSGSEAARIPARSQTGMYFPTDNNVRDAGSQARNRAQEQFNLQFGHNVLIHYLKTSKFIAKPLRYYR